jgi:predicted XRE-type DNA-binding protein
VAGPATAADTFAAVKDDSDPVPLLKQQLARAILDHVGRSGQVNLASRIGVDQPRASDLLGGRLERFSLQQLVRFAARADGEVTLNIRWTSRRVWIIPPRSVNHRLPPSSR